MSAVRDTDADWRHLGDTEPHWGVLTAPRFRREALDDAALAEFYSSGRRNIEAFARDIARFTGRPPGGRALDFGCGVGRLTEAMTAYAEAVTGYDVSPGMLARARARDGAATYVDTLPDGPFDWINSFIVFQHIPPARGMRLMGDLLSRLAPGGAVSLHVTVDRAESMAAGPGRRRLGGERGPLGEINMFDYDLTAVTSLLRRAGVRRLHLEATDHSGHYGYVVIGRRETDPEASPASVEPEAYRFGEDVSLGWANDPRQRLSGFSWAEPWGRWTDGEFAQIRLRHHGLASDGVLRLWVHTAFAPPGADCRVRVFLNGLALCERVALPHAVIEVPVMREWLAEPGAAEIGLEIQQPKRADDPPLDDGRALGLGLESWAIQEGRPS